MGWGGAVRVPIRGEQGERGGREKEGVRSGLREEEEGPAEGVAALGASKAQPPEEQALQALPAPPPAAPLLQSGL